MPDKIKCTQCDSENVSVFIVNKKCLDLLDCHCKDCEWDFIINIEKEMNYIIDREQNRNC